MKFKITMKDPDTLGDAIEVAAKASVDSIPDLSEEERDAIEEKRRMAFQKVASKWFEWGEYLTVEIDTDAETITVCEK